MSKSGQHYTSGNWVVKQGSEEEFVARWTEFTEWALKNAPGAQSFVLIRRDDDPRHFVSFGAWNDAESAAAWKNMPEFAEDLGRLRALCDEFTSSDSTVAAAVGF